MLGVGLISITEWYKTAFCNYYSRSHFISSNVKLLIKYIYKVKKVKHCHFVLRSRDNRRDVQRITYGSNKLVIIKRKHDYLNCNIQNIHLYYISKCKISKLFDKISLD